MSPHLGVVTYAWVPSPERPPKAFKDKSWKMLDDLFNVLLWREGLNPKPQPPRSLLARKADFHTVLNKWPVVLCPVEGRTWKTSFAA